MPKQTTGRGGRTLDVAATRAARERHAAGVKRLQRACQMPVIEIPEQGKRGAAERAWRRATTPARDWTRPFRLPSKAARRAAGKAQRKARRAQR